MWPKLQTLRSKYVSAAAKFQKLRLSRPIDSSDLAQLCAQSVADKKAESIAIMDLRGISDLTDYYVLANGMSDPHLRAIRDDVEKLLAEEHDLRPLRVQGEITSGWIILDYVDVVIHLFNREKRETYGLETLWNDATITDWTEDTVATSTNNA